MSPKKILLISGVLILFISILLIGYGGILKYSLAGGKKFKILRNIAISFAEIPWVLTYIKNGEILNPNAPRSFYKHQNKKRFFNTFHKKKREELLVLPRYDGDLKRSVVEIIDLNTFKIIHTYKHDIDEMNNKVKNTSIEHSRIQIDDDRIRFEYRHPIILDDGSLISHSEYSPAFKIDLCNNLIWINDEEKFHHSIMKMDNDKIVFSSQMFPYSKLIQKYLKDNYIYNDDAITIMNTDGKILYQKSISELLIENNILKTSDLFDKETNISNLRNFKDGFDPIHINDIEPAMTSGKYWKKGDLFLSLRNKNSIVHFRPSENKVINYIKGPFLRQHDVDIISDYELSIFNNNISIHKKKISEIVIYNFENNSFKTKFEDQLENLDLFTYSQGLSEFFDDGSILIEEQNEGRIVLIDSKGKLEWEYVNKSSKNKVYFISWSRVIKNKNLITSIKRNISNKKCLN